MVSAGRGALGTKYLVLLVNISWCQIPSARYLAKGHFAFPPCVGGAYLSTTRKMGVTETKRLIGFFDDDN